jgi:hypothetical protein
VLFLEDLETIETVAKLLGLETDDVRDITVQRQINVRGNITEIPLKVQEVRKEEEEEDDDSFPPFLHSFYFYFSFPINISRLISFSASREK